VDFWTIPVSSRLGQNLGNGWLASKRNWASWLSFQEPKKHKKILTLGNYLLHMV
jgi:hypothetical protein